MIGFNEISMNSAAWLLVFARMGGLLGMNPLFARRNVPAPVRAAFIERILPKSFVYKHLYIKYTPKLTLRLED